MRPGICAITLSLLASTVAAGELHGQLELYAGGRALRPTEAADAVIYFRTAAMPALTPPAEPAEITTRRKQFMPRVLAIQAGTTVRFPNEDAILHNAFSSSPGNVFDTGAYGSGGGASHTFTTPGLVKIYCNVHHAMFAHILVLDTPWFTRPDPQGRFTLHDLPDTPGELVVFHDRTAPWQQTVDPRAAAGITVRLELTRRRVPPHANKFGKPYRADDDGRGY